ncbi:MAG: hypothetical protein PHP98_04200, partial [Kiritimatiellae bacterium]|nr:hypothetical protein [Kiritimatiellia bacterium]
MKEFRQYAAAALVVLAALTACAQQRPYIGFVYPAGGRQGASFQATIGGQFLDGVCGAHVSGPGVRAGIVEYNKMLSNQQIALLREQLKELKKTPAQKPDEKTEKLIAKLEKIISEDVRRPASMAIANRVIVAITIASDAAPGRREIRLVTARGISNPLVFNVSQLPEFAAPPLPTSPQQVLGKEQETVRMKKRVQKQEHAMEMADTMMMTATEAENRSPPDKHADDADNATEARVKTPCILNGQIYSGTVDRFRFGARKGQRLVISAQARELIPYLADAVPGWFQAVLTLYNAAGREAAYNDDYRFKPDPVILYEVPADGEYVLAIHDAVYRGREDFVYRVAIGELPFLTSIFPLGGRAGTQTTVEINGWNLAENSITPDIAAQEPGTHAITARGKKGGLSNPLPFALDTLPECFEKGIHDTPASAQEVTPPVIINGRIETPGNRDMFRFEGRAGDEIVLEVKARRLDSPLDSILKLIDAAGNCLELNDDYEDICSGLNTHHADSYIRAALPSNGVYFVQLSDAQQKGGNEYAYRLRISAPQPDFALRVTPSGVNIRDKGSSPVTIRAVRRDGFAGEIKLSLKNAPEGFALSGRISGAQEVARVALKTSLAGTIEPVPLLVEGRAIIGTQEVVRAAAPAEDRMQAFLWRHLVPAQELDVFVFTPPPPKIKPA